MTWRPAAVVLVGAGVLALAGAVVGGGPWPWVAAALVVGVTAVVTAVDIALAADPRRVRLHREGERAIWLGDSAQVSVTVHNTSSRVLRGSVRDAWVPSARAAPYDHDLVLRPNTAARLTTTLTPIRRGDRAAVLVMIRSYGPLRLGFRQPSRRAATAGTPGWTLRVYPPFSARRFLPEKLARLRVLDGATVMRGRGQGTEFDTLREYVIGDDVRSVDWRASARRSEVVVRTWRPERDRRVLCVLDTGRTSAARIGDEPRLDAAIDAALLLATLAARADDRVDLLAIDTAVRASVTAGRRALLPRLVSALAPLTPALVETDFELVTGEVLRRARKRALVVLFTALEPGAVGEGLLPVLPKLAARHKVVVAAVHDPELVRLSTAPALPNVTAADVYTAAAAHRTLAERERVRTVLARSGVEVVDAPVRLFASRVADTYLAMKAAGRL
ncbi:MAG: DUF58 domain-containing protein [Dactylosporangium sp.]|nr:DUF58 domain-containing protein [Dactylosporangium sp.]